jgi:hypothetical protein
VDTPVGKEAVRRTYEARLAWMESELGKSFRPAPKMLPKGVSSSKHTPYLRQVIVQIQRGSIRFVLFGATCALTDEETKEELEEPAGQRHRQRVLRGRARARQYEGRHLPARGAVAADALREVPPAERSSREGRGGGGQHAEAGEPRRGAQPPRLSLLSLTLAAPR